jgi:PTS system nitrogen regulatory IIA component
VIQDLFQRELLFASFDARSRDDALAQLARHIAENAAGLNGAALLRALKEREAQATTAFGDGVAIPHARITGLDRMIAAFARSESGIAWDAPDKQAVHLILMLAGPADKPEMYLKTLAAGSRLLREARSRDRLMAAESDEDLLRALQVVPDR